MTPIPIEIASVSKLRGRTLTYIPHFQEPVALLNRFPIREIQHRIWSSTVVCPFPHDVRLIDTVLSIADWIDKERRDGSDNDREPA
ncbi:hypothetical protein GWI33_009974 [Rhynchophorus ferrugineus]|uniref:Uncharacterized protein n=1 Tax=Rhynchophorus ferrugineus TaxID=354439 RepID=A0A834J233_RHYFE|nr:hypothetical protein GWI33_009974 [Rhynchophorus ferrugineus]